MNDNINIYYIQGVILLILLLVIMKQVEIGIGEN